MDLPLISLALSILEAKILPGDLLELLSLKICSFRNANVSPFYPIGVNFNIDLLSVRPESLKVIGHNSSRSKGEFSVRYGVCPLRIWLHCGLGY